MSQKSPFSYRLTWLWCSLFAYSALFGLLQKILTPVFPEGVVLLICGAAASAVPLVWSALAGDKAPCPSARKASPRGLVFLLSVALSGNFVMMLLTPLLERVWKLIGFTAQAAAVGEETASPLLALYICVIGPVLEELIYRGVVMRRLLPAGERQAILLSALCFGLMHHDLYQGLSAFWCGIVFGFAALRYGLAASIGLHIAGNSLAVALPLLRQAGTPGALTTLLLVFVPVVVAAAGGIRLLFRVRRTPRPADHAVAGSGVGGDPVLWILLAFDLLYLIAASFTRL